MPGSTTTPPVARARLAIVFGAALVLYLSIIAPARAHDYHYLLAPSSVCGNPSERAPIDTQLRSIRCYHNQARLHAHLVPLRQEPQLGWAARHRAADHVRCRDLGPRPCGRGKPYWQARSGYRVNPACGSRPTSSQAALSSSKAGGPTTAARPTMSTLLRSDSARANLLLERDRGFGWALQRTPLFGGDFSVWVAYTGWRRCEAPAHATGPTVPAPAPPLRGIWAEAHEVSDAELAVIKALGYGVVFAKPVKADLDRVEAAGLKAVVWLGGYRDGNDSPPRCVWRIDDATVAAQVDAVEAHPATAYYFVDDEPHANAGECADTPGQIRARNALIKAHDPSHPTFITENRTADYSALANTTDVMALTGYPCNWNNTSSCSRSNIAGRIHAAEAAGVRRYWGVPQVEQEPRSLCPSAYYRFPSPREYTTLINQWRQSREEAEFAFMWNRVFSCGVGLSQNPALQAAVGTANR